jgi:DNA-directed RNA polymerase specialized sigma subunit
VQRNLPLARGLVQRYRHPGKSLDDLTLLAAMALVKAVDS